MSKMITAIASAAVGALCLLVPAMAQDGSKMITPPDVKWGPAPASFPPGAEAAVLYGDPTKNGLFALRLKLPKGYAIAPHTHPNPEVVTVLSGEFRLGMGSSADRGTTHVLPAGSLSAMPPGTPHFAYFDQETVLQLNSVGPWGLTYLNPKDDPRQKSQ